MARPKGVKNKPKVSNGLEVLMFEKQIAGSPINRNTHMGYINWGERNDYPNMLLNLYNESPTHHSAINFGVQSIVGNGVDYEAMKINGDEIVPNHNQTWDEIIKAIATDYMLYGSYAIEIILNKDGMTYSFYHIPLEKVRWEAYDADGNINGYWISNDWTSVGQYPPIQIEAFDMAGKIEYGKPYLYVYRTYSPTTTYYTTPHYIAALRAIQAEIEYVNYDFKHIVNGFAAAGVITLPEMETDEQRRAMIKNIQSMFQGGNNANSIAITFRNSIEDKPVEWTPFQQVSNVNQYADANQRVINRILSAHQIPNASLIGMPDVGNSGFSSEADKLEVSYQLYNKLTGNYNRMAVIRTLNQMLKLNGVDTEIIMKPLSFNDFGNDADVRERTSSALKEDDIKNNVEEKVEQ